MRIEKIKEKMKKLLNRIISVALPVSILTMSCGTNVLVVSAAESNNKIVIINNMVDVSGNSMKDTYTFNIPDGYEFVGYLKEDDVTILNIKLVKGNKAYFIEKVIGNYRIPREGIRNDGKPYTGELLNSNMLMYSGQNTIYASCNVEILSGKFKIFKSLTDFDNYLSTGGGNYDIVKPDELEKGWYLKNVQYKVTADDSPSSEAGADATYIHFSWDTDNLQEGDLLEIKTHNYYKKILGEKLSGFYDYITKSDGISAYTGSYSFSQYKATNAWFSSLENKPVAFKEFDTTDYYLRPYRQGQYGGWVHIKMGRSTPTSSPYIEDVEYGDFDDDNNWTVDEDLTDKNGGHHGIDQGGSYIPPDQTENPFTGTNIAGIFQYFYDFMKQIPAMIGDLPALVENIISFLPNPIIAFIGIGVIVAIILRIVGR